MLPAITAVLASYSHAKSCTAQHEFGVPLPGLLSFRELPAVLAAFGQLRTLPDLALCDGQGIAHPRRLGIASHLGLWLDLPTIGVGKSRLTGSFDPPGERKGDSSPLLDGSEQIGAVVRTRTAVRPLFVSPGHRVSLTRSIDIVLAACSRYRLPEPIRAADRIASRGSGPRRACRNSENAAVAE